jgi:hypothetical protein
MPPPRGALALYREILRAARALPTSSRRAYVRRKLREEFVAARDASGERLTFLLAYGEVCLENVQAQAAHLSERALFKPSAL